MNCPCAWCDFDPTLQITGSWLITVPKPALSSNQLKSNLPGKAGFVYRKYRNDFKAAIEPQIGNIPAATGRRRVFFTREFAAPAREFDRDNMVAGMKPVRDCLTELGLLVDDKNQWLQAHYRQQRTGMTQVVIVIEDILWKPSD